MAISEESGDVDGIELRVMHGKHGNLAEFEIAEGGCEVPQVVSLSRQGGLWWFVWTYRGAPGGDLTNRYWIRREASGLRLGTDAADSQMGWLVPNPAGRLLRSVRQPKCFH